MTPIKSEKIMKLKIGESFIIHTDCERCNGCKLIRVPPYRNEGCPDCNATGTVLHSFKYKARKLL